MSYNQAFIDGQNLYLSTKANSWTIDLYKLRRYLAEKYLIAKAYYFLGAADPAHQKLYDLIRAANFIPVFRAHSQEMRGKKKGNVDTDIVFTIITKTIGDRTLNKIFLVSGDGDYYLTINYLIAKKRFGKLLVPSRRAMSSLYKSLEPRYISFLDDLGVRAKIELR